MAIYIPTFDGCHKSDLGRVNMIILFSGYETDVKSSDVSILVAGHGIGKEKK